MAVGNKLIPIAVDGHDRRQAGPDIGQGRDLPCNFFTVRLCPEPMLGVGLVVFALQEIRDIAEAVGIGAVKYADYSNNRTSDYVFALAEIQVLVNGTNAAPPCPSEAWR